MAALSGPRDTQILGYNPNRKLNFGVESSQQIWLGALVMLNNDGYLIDGYASATGIAAGVALQSVLGNAVDGGVTCDVKPCIAKFDNKSTDKVVQADVGLNCYISDDHTVAHTAGSLSVAGKVVYIDPVDGGVWVNLSPL